MPRTVKQHLDALEFVSAAELLRARDFLDNVMVREDGAFVAGFELGGVRSYYYDNSGMNDLKINLEALVRAIPNDRCRLQFRYEIKEGAGKILDEYEKIRRNPHPMIQLLDEFRMADLRAIDAAGSYLSRRLTCYLIWDPPRDKEKEDDVIVAACRGLLRSIGGTTFGGVLRRTLKQHEELLGHFESMVRQIEIALGAARLGPRRMSHTEMFSEFYSALNPAHSDTKRLVHRPESALLDNQITPRSHLADSWIDGQPPKDYLDIEGVYHSIISLKEPPDGTLPGLLREALALKFPLVINVTASLPNQAKSVNQYKTRLRKMIAAQKDSGGGFRINMDAQVAQGQLMEVLHSLLSGSLKACLVNVSFVVRTSRPALTPADHEAARRELEERRQTVLSAITRMNGAAGFIEKYAIERLFPTTLPGLAETTLREMDALSLNAADLLPIERPWEGTPNSPLLLLESTYNSLLPFSMFDPSFPNFNVLIMGTSGSGKTFITQQQLLQVARAGAQIIIIEPGSSYEWLIGTLGGRILELSLDSRQTFNPWDLPKVEREPTNEQITFLRNLAVHMIGGGVDTDVSLLQDLLTEAIKATYERVGHREKPIPIFSDLQQQLESWTDAKRVERIEDLAKLAAIKLRSWCGNGVYANLFDRPTNLELYDDYVYFNIERIKEDPKLEAAISYLIAHLIYSRSSEKGDRPKVIIFDEAWSMLDSPVLGHAIVEMFRAGRRRYVSSWAISQAPEDFTGTEDNPRPYGPGIVKNTYIKIFGKQVADETALAKALGLNEVLIRQIRTIPPPIKGEWAQLLLVAGETPETAQMVFVRPTPLDYWICTTHRPEVEYRRKILEETGSYQEAIFKLATTFPFGFSRSHPEGIVQRERIRA